jgi:energy-coupling factor transport system ATP-binding protein
MSRAKKILLAGYLALGFLALRLVYAFLFGGLTGDQVLISLPEIRLSGPFAHISLLGPVSVEGIVRNLELAMPFAVSIVVFGAVASLISAQFLIVASKKVPPLRNLLSAVAIGLSSIPALFDSSRKVFAARELRGEKHLRMLVPLLERAIELATALGLRLATEPSGNLRARSISLRNLEVLDTGLGPIDLEITPGELVVISGATGSGKSTLLEAIAGVLGEYRGRELTGSISFDGLQDLSVSEISNFVRYIPQNPREQIWGLDSKQILSRVPEEISGRFSLNPHLAKDVSALSEGEVLKLVLAQSLAFNPTILLLDEPYAPLDASSRVELTKLITDLNQSGMTIVVVEHEPEHTVGLKARRIQLLQGSLEPGQHKPQGPKISRTEMVVGTEVAVSAQLSDIGFTDVLIHSPKLELRQGERVWLSGDNGSGKSSLLIALAKSEGVLVHGQRPTNPRALALVPENFDDFFVTDSLSGELARADKVAGVSPGFTRTTLESILPLKELALWNEIHPRDLSRGTRLALAISMQLSHKPQALLVDEPFRGLDLRARELIVESLRCVAETGCAVLFASHEGSWSEALASRKLEIRERVLVQVAEVNA